MLPKYSVLGVSVVLCYVSSFAFAISQYFIVNRQYCEILCTEMLDTLKQHLCISVNI